MPPCLKKVQESVILLNGTFNPFFTYCGLKKTSLPYMIRKVFINMKGFPHLSLKYVCFEKKNNLTLHLTFLLIRSSNVSIKMFLLYLAY